VAIGDFNNDTKLDLTVANMGDNSVNILLGNRDGTFQNPLTYAVGNGPSSVAIGAFKDPRKLDIVVVNAIANSLSILLSSCFVIDFFIFKWERYISKHQLRRTFF
jgi:hypothetical protein